MEKMNSKKEGLLVADLVPSSDFPNFFESQDNPGKIVRIEDSQDLLEKHGQKFSVEELVTHAQELFGELQKKYHISVPATFGVGKDAQGLAVAYSVVDKIERTQISEEHLADALEKSKDLYASISLYFLNKYDEEGLYLWDINAQEQYVYGRRFGERESKFYLVDTDIWFANSRAEIPLVVYWLTRHMSSMEAQTKTLFYEARNHIRAFLNKAKQSGLHEPGDPNLVAIEHYLNREPSDYSPNSAIPRFE